MRPTSPFQIHWPRVETAPKPPEISLASLREQMRAMVAVGWQRLSPACDDVLNLLCDHTPATQWTMGWGPTDGRLYLLMWHKTGWHAEKRWTLLVDGVYRFEWPDAWHWRDSRRCREMMEGRRARTLSAHDLVRPLILNTPFHGNAGFDALEKCLLDHPFLWDGLKEALFHALQTPADRPPAPDTECSLMDLIPLQQLESVLPLLSLLMRVMKGNPRVSEADHQCFEGIRHNLLRDHASLGRLLAPSLRPAWEQSSRRFQYLLPTMRVMVLAAQAS